jgi:glycosyltransferase involved in cell wall biosynthesis
LEVRHNLLRMTEGGASSGEKLRIAFDMTFPDRNQGGSGMYARHLVASLRKRSDVMVIEIRSSRPGVAHTVKWLAVDAARQLRNSGAQLLHSPSFVTPWRVGVPYVVTVFDLSTRRFPADHPLEWRVYERWLLPPRARAAGRVISISEVTRRDVISEYGVEPASAVTVYPGVDDRFFARSDQARRKESSEPVLLFPGAPVARKNLEVVLQAMAHADAQSLVGRACLRISGATAGLFPQHDARIRELGLADRVEWLGLVPPDQMPAIMAGADAVVYPSFYEGFGFPPLEAMAGGTPVVASNASCLPEILGDAALLIDPTDVRGLATAIESVLGEMKVRERLIEAGLERAANFTWERCAEETVAAYREVLASAA